MTIQARSRVPIEDLVEGTKLCEHRTVSKDGRIVCAKIVEGDNRVARELCQICPARDVNCAHLRFSLRQTAPSPLIVRYNGRTEIWDDDPPGLCFEHAACAERIIPIEDAHVCARCVLRQPLDTAVERPLRRQAAGTGAVVPFPQRQTAAAAG